MSKLLSRTQDQSPLSRSPEIVIAGTTFSRKRDTYLIDGIAVGEAAWHERLRGARELHRVICEIFTMYPIGTSN